jgi:hypothetical protein
MSELDAAWESVPKAPTVATVDPIEHLCRTLRGAIAANRSLWRCIDLEAGTALLAELAKKRGAPTSGIPLEPVMARLVRPHVTIPRIALAESLLAFQKEAKDAGFVVHLPRVVAELNEERRQELLRTFYGRLARGGEGANARRDALAGTLVVFAPPARTQTLVKVLCACVVLGGFWLLIDPGGRPPGPKPMNLGLPDDALPCAILESHGQVLRCTMSAATLRAFSAEEERARRLATRTFAEEQGLKDVLVLDSDSGLPLTPR